MSDMAPASYYFVSKADDDLWETTDGDRVEFDDQGREWHR